jgi:hypothetical protein
MPTTLPCPNPTCTHVFAPDALRGAAALKCPKCGTVFRFKNSGGPAARPAAKATPRAAPVAPPPAEPHPEVFVPPPESAGPRRRPRARARGGCLGWVLLLVVLGVVAGLGVAGWLLRDQLFGGQPPEEPGSFVQSPAMNYRFRLPPEAWSQDHGVERELGASLAMRRSDPGAWFAIAVKDYRDRNPRSDELQQEATTRLKKLFKKGIEQEMRADEAFAGQPAQRFVFTGENASKVAVSGECLMTAYNGIGYLFFGWTPSASDESVLADVQQQWRDVRQGFSLMKEREGWVGKQPEIVDLQGRGVGYHLKYTKGLWENDEPGDADLVLLGRDPDNPQVALRRAWIRTYIRFPPARDLEAAMKHARAIVEAREKQLYPEVKLQPVPEAVKGGLADGEIELGKSKAQIERLRVKKGDDFEHFFAVAAVQRPGYTLVVVCECPWQYREAWESRFGAVLHGLQFEGK